MALAYRRALVCRPCHISQRLTSIKNPVPAARVSGVQELLWTRKEENDGCQTRETEEGGSYDEVHRYAILKGDYLPRRLGLSAADFDRGTEDALYALAHHYRGNPSVKP